MTKINELNIVINKALITHVGIDLTEKGVQLDVRGELYTKAGKSISNFSFSTTSWNDENKFDIPAYINAPIRQIFEDLTPIIYEKINGKAVAIKDKNVKSR